MTTNFAKRMAIAFGVTAAVLAALPRPTVGQQATPARGDAAGAWTFDEALAHLRLFPRDAYVQYVALQLGRREGRLQEAAQLVMQFNPRRDQWMRRQGQIDLFSIFSGQLAVQESLQLDAMAPEMTEQMAMPAVPQDRAGPAPVEAGPAPRPEPKRDTVAVADLTGPTIKSHPWREMLAGREVEVTGLALSVPSDFYFVSFRSVNKLLEATELSSKWGAHAFNQANRDAQTQLVNERVQEQLAIEVSPLLRPFYDAVVDETAIVGGDLFLREGSDVTMLFHVTQPAVFRAKMDEFLATALNGSPDAVRTEGRYLGVDYVHVATPDWKRHVYSAYPAPDLHVRSNSLVGLQRVLAAIQGRDENGRPVERLGETDEFRYIRTLMPQGALEEDGLIYLSDPFVRRLMSPALRLTERRRMVCYNHLRMIGHAGLLHQTQSGQSAASLEALTKAGMTPGEFGQGRLACPEHGQYSLAADGLTGVCSKHGYASYLTPCSEVEATHVTEMEAAAYREFVQMYNGFWRQFFDPIAIRLQITPERYRAETIVLPLIDNTIYTGLARMLGSQPEPLDALPVPKRNIFSINVRLDKARILHDMGLDAFIQEAEPLGDDVLAEEEASDAAMKMRQIMLGLLNHESARREMPAANTNGLSWRVRILPYLEEGGRELYQQFRLNEPWDSEHNRRLIPLMPAIFASGNAALTAEGKTRFVVPRGAGTAFGDGRTPPKLRTISDGTSNTVLLLEADDEHAVIWTKPDDVELAPGDAPSSLHMRPPGAFLVTMCDGSLISLRQEIPGDVFAALLTSAAGDQSDWRSFGVAPPQWRGQRRTPQGREAAILAHLQLGELLTKGVGNQVGFHVYDSEPMFDLSIAQLVGMFVRFNRGFGGFDEEMLMIVPLVGALNGPVYVSIPVKDRAIVDGFLDRLDHWLVELARQQEGGFISVEQDFYHLNFREQGAPRVRAYGLQVGPLKWRFFWSRIGDAVYIASKREVLDDLFALEAAGGPPPAGSPRDPGAAPAHGLVRMRPQHWDRVLSAYRLGWEENNRQACLKNLGPLTSLSRALASAGAGSSVTLDRVEAYAERVYDVHHFCPDGGHYEFADDGKSVLCTVHGDVLQPHQGEEPAEASELGQLLRQFRDMSIALTFLEDGLHAVVTLDREASEK